MGGGRSKRQIMRELVKHDGGGGGGSAAASVSFSRGEKRSWRMSEGNKKTKRK